MLFDSTAFQSSLSCLNMMFHYKVYLLNEKIWQKKIVGGQEFGARKEERQIGASVLGEIFICKSVGSLLGPKDALVFFFLSLSQLS